MSATQETAARSGGATARYARKKEAIVAAASDILNHQGVKGMTLAGVASRVGLTTTSVTYYFKKKEDLAVACFLDGITRFDELASDALRVDGPHERVQRLLEAWLDLRRRIAAGEAPAIAVFNDIRALQKPQRGVVLQAYMRFFDKIREIFVAPQLSWLDAPGRTARAQILTEQIFWAVAWLPRYDLEDYDRIRERMYDIFVHGLAAPGRHWEPQALSLDTVLESSAQELTPRETFLIAATRLINEQGYRGASVEKISSRLNVTKGSFYHHHEAKDDLVVDCFKRSFEVMRRVQRAVGSGDQDELTKLATAASALVDYQLSARGPLLRTSALTALPEPICLQMVEASNRVSDRFASLISDGIASGSVRAVDPYIAAQMLTATLNASAEIRWWIPDVDRAYAPVLYAKPVLTGIFSR
ncbi:MAG TPA: TetR/AcrR family transcriptional regulator [Steroidobacteraceae bacterium]|jgi:AcrR family transcriptional regulator|nr:TetR/AcrR family transcriptional regulator [Steroidobacteraceae bacterium]